LIEAPLL